MRTRIIALAIVAAIVLACHGPTSPTPTPTPTPSPTPTPQIRSLKIDGPTRFAPTTSPSYVATATFSDGSSQDYSSKVHWFAYSSTGASPIAINSSGTVTVHSTGEAVIQAGFNGVFASTSVMVIPDGTYRLVGTIQEVGLPVTDATVTVVAGTGTGVSATSDFQGKYRLYGVAGAVQVQVRKPGYDTVTSAFSVTTDDALDFPNMSGTGGPPIITGTYSLSIVAAADCVVTRTPPLATPFRNRTYTAVVTEGGLSAQVTLSGANFAVQNGKGNQFSGRVSPGHVTFTLGDTGTSDYYYFFYSAGTPDVVEQLDANTFLSFWGTADATISSSGIIGTFSGNIVTYGTASAKATESCASYHHQFTMTPLSSTRRKK